MGCVPDVVLDLRKSPLTFGESVAFALSARNRHLVHILVGFAHRFLRQEDNSCLIYKTNAVHTPDCDAKIMVKSSGFDWPVKLLKNCLLVRKTKLILLS